MKKYVKPELIYERYELTHQIADCSMELQFASAETCTAQGDANSEFSDLQFLFLSGNKDCQIQLESYCYMNADGNGFVLSHS